MVLTLPVFGIERLGVFHLDNRPVERCFVLMVSHVAFELSFSVGRPFGRIKVLKVALVMEFIKALLFQRAYLLAIDKIVVLVFFLSGPVLERGPYLCIRAKWSEPYSYICLLSIIDIRSLVWPYIVILLRNKAVVKLSVGLFY